jgi:hypothetical protein
MTPVELAGILGAVLMAGVAAFQVGLAMGVPLGDATMGGRAPTVDGRLTAPYRIVALLSAAILLVGAWIVLARAGVVTSGVLGDAMPRWGIWVVVAFSLLNTLTNIGGRHPLERYGFSAVTLLVAVLAGFVALSG